MAYTKATRDGLLPAIRNNALLPADISFDLTKDLDLRKLAENLNRSINSRRPGTCTFIWQGERALKRQELDIQHQRNLLEQIGLLGRTADEMANTQASLFLMPETLQAIICNRREEMAWHRAEALKRMELADKQHADTLDAIEDFAFRRKLANLREQVEIDSIKAKTRITELQGEMLDKIKTEFDLNNITAEQAFILIKCMDTSADASVNFMAQEAMLDAQVDKMKAETAKKKAEAKREYIQADADELTLNQTRKRYD